MPVMEEVVATRESRYIWKTKLCEEERGDSGGRIRYNMRGCYSRLAFYKNGNKKKNSREIKIEWQTNYSEHKHTMCRHCPKCFTYVN